ncbi:hypothetical protein LIA77_11606 [Sarocladium implicatum]|nr:hypothetical protein LIA77_11606 [Sarocladium implicatum]
MKLVIFSLLCVPLLPRGHLEEVGSPRGPRGCSLVSKANSRCPILVWDKLKGRLRGEGIQDATLDVLVGDLFALAPATVRFEGVCREMRLLQIATQLWTPTGTRDQNCY